MAPLPISVFIIVKNEADRLGASLAAVRDLADDIVVVDSGSTDGTQALAASLGARVIHNDWPGYGRQKRFAEGQCRHDWVLNLDADEVVPPIWPNRSARSSPTASRHTPPGASPSPRFFRARRAPIPGPTC
ncbi:hypothetical protein GCM10025880_30770 [Methylorubrum aminovorans]|nr:hypothetical protein GCM10025880_30770 [Methylorubrum aminovorans]